MFTLSFSQRRRLCRWLFAIGCVAPTVCVLLWAAASRTQAYRDLQAARWSAKLTRWFGVRVTVDAIQWNWRGDQQLEQMTLTDPESGAPLGSIRRVLITQREQRAVLRLEGAEIQTAQSRRLWEAFHERLLRSPDAPDWKGLLVAEDAVFWTDGQPLTVRDVRCSYLGGEASRSAIVEFGFAWYDRKQSVRWEILRQREGADPTTHWRLDSRTTPLPCRLLAAVWPLNQWLGDRAEFAGLAAGASSTQQGALLQAQGQLTRVDLGALAQGGPGALQGAARVQLDNLVWNQGRMVLLAGRCDADQGNVDSAWLEAFARGIDTRRVVAPQAPQRIAFNGLHGSFRLDRVGLRLIGDCEQAPGAMLAQGNQPLLTPESHQVPLSSLILYLAPLTRQPHGFAASLPTPWQAPAVATLNMASDR